MLLITRAQEYLDKLSVNAHSDPALLNELANAHSKLAQVLGHPGDANLGDIQGATAHYRKAIELITEASTLAPNDMELIDNLAGTQVELAIVLDDFGDSDASIALLDRTASMPAPIVAQHSEMHHLTYELARTYRHRAMQYSGRNQLDSCVEYFDKAHRIFERLHRDWPNDESYTIELSYSHKHLGEALMLKRNLSGAMEHYQRALALDEGRVARKPQSVKAKFDLTHDYSGMALVMGLQGRYDESVSLYGKSLALRKAILERDPNDTRARAGVANNLSSMGKLAYEKADHSTALEQLQQALQVYDELVSHDPQNRSLQAERMDTSAALGSVHNALAFKNGTLPINAQKHCRQSLDLSTPWIAELRQRNQSGHMAVGNDTTLAELEKLASRCEQLLARNR
jgi:tetratricopeptide (TPR) repeat protein